MKHEAEALDRLITAMRENISVFHPLHHLRGPHLAAAKGEELITLPQLVTISRRLMEKEPGTPLNMRWSEWRAAIVSELVRPEGQTARDVLDAIMLADRTVRELWALEVRESTVPGSPTIDPVADSTELVIDMSAHHTAFEAGRTSARADCDEEINGQRQKITELSARIAELQEKNNLLTHECGVAWDSAHSRERQVDALVGQVGSLTDDLTRTREQLGVRVSERDRYHNEADQLRAQLKGEKSRYEELAGQVNPLVKERDELRAAEINQRHTNAHAREDMRNQYESKMKTATALLEGERRMADALRTERDAARESLGQIAKLVLDGRPVKT